jgi:selenocysteine lyase/cysteine desulfurase
MADALYWIRPASMRAYQAHHIQGFRRGIRRMTYLDLVFSYGTQPRENELRAIDGMREVYGIRSVRFNEKERTVRVEFDASRLKQDTVAMLLRQAGIDIREPVELA